MTTKTKQAQANVPGVMKIASAHMRKLATQNATLHSENKKLASEVKLVKIARRMEIRGIQPHLSFEEKLAGLASLDETKLASIEQAIELAAGGFNLGTVHQPEEGQKTASHRGADDLDAFVSSQQALG